jgi:hypothetical protein
LNSTTNRIHNYKQREKKSIIFDGITVGLALTCLRMKATTSVDSQKLEWKRGVRATVGKECNASGQYRT